MAALSTIILCGHQYLDIFFASSTNYKDPSVDIQSIIFLCFVQTVHIIQGTSGRPYWQHSLLSSVLQRLKTAFVVPHVTVVIQHCVPELTT